MGQNCTLSFQEVWDELAAQLTVDNPYYWVTRWENVKLKTWGDQVTLADWLIFRAQFEAALAKVTDYTNMNVVETLLKQLPKMLV